MRARRGADQSAARSAAAGLPPGLGPVNAISGAAAVTAVVSVILIAAQSRWTFTFADGLFWGGVVAFLVLRAVAVRFAPAREREAVLRRLAMRALVIGGAAVALWIGAQSVQSRSAAQGASDPPARVMRLG